MSGWCLVWTLWELVTSHRDKGGFFFFKDRTKKSQILLQAGKGSLSMSNVLVGPGMSQSKAAVLDFSTFRRIWVSRKTEADRDEGATTQCSSEPCSCISGLVWTHRPHRTSTSSLLVCWRRSSFLTHFFHSRQWAEQKSSETKMAVAGAASVHSNVCFAETGFLSETSPSPEAPSGNLRAYFGVCLESIISTSNDIAVLRNCHCYPELMILY